jgi:peroxiredoxin family protein
MGDLEKKVEELEKQIQMLSTNKTNTEKNGTAIVMFSGEMDRVIAALNIAIGNLSLGKEVSLFFTFWGTTIMRKKAPQSSSKHILQKMFGWMLPKGYNHLPLSRLNFFGLGPLMMKFLMKKYQFAEVQELMETAISLDAKIYICSMSMELMGIKKEELMNDSEYIYAGVAGFMEVVEKSSLTLFI